MADRIVYQRARERGTRWFSVWTLDLIDGEPRYPTEVVFSADYAAIAPTWNTDGTALAFCSVASTPPPDADFATPDQVSDIWTVGADGTNRIRLTDGHSRNFGPVWSKQGRIIFTSTRSGHENVWSILPPRDAEPVSTEPGSLTSAWPEATPVADADRTNGAPG